MWKIALPKKRWKSKHLISVELLYRLNPRRGKRNDTEKIAVVRNLWYPGVLFLWYKNVFFAM
jgi:hypothetical protein